MGRPQKPAEVHEISGAWRKNPSRGRARAGEVRQIAPLGDPPEKWKGSNAGGMYAELSEIWKEIAFSAPPKSLNVSHRIIVEMICRLTYRMRHNLAKAAELGQLATFLGRLRMTPEDWRGSGESKPPARGGSEWGEYVG